MDIQRDESLSDSESMSGDSFVSSNSGSDLTDTEALPITNSDQITPNPAKVVGNAATAPSQQKTPLPPPIIISAPLWRQAVPIIFHDSTISHTGLFAKSTSDGKIHLKTSNATQFRQIQKTLLFNNIQFHTFSLAADRQLKVVIKGIPTDYSVDEIKTELLARNFEVQLIRRFGPTDKPMPICLVILSGTNAKDIYELTELFYLKIIIESFKKTGPSQCHSCQKFGHGSKNCGNSPRCVKCAGTHNTSECTKTRDQPPTCANCNGAHTANFRGCPSYSEIIKKFTKNSSTQINHTSYNSTYPATLPQSYTPQTQPPSSDNLPTQNLNYANVTKKEPSIPTDKIITLLTNLLSAISTTNDPKIIISATISSFLDILKNSHE